MRRADILTRAVVSALHDEYSYPEIAHRAGLERRYWPVLSRIVRDGSVSLEAENAVRVGLGMEPLPPVYEMPPCPDCHGAPHAGRCNGKPVAKVVALAPGEVVRKTPAPRRATRIADMSTRDLALAIRERIEYP